MIRKLLCWLGTCFEKLLCKIGIRTWYWDRKIHKDDCWHCMYCGKIKRFDDTQNNLRITDE